MKTEKEIRKLMQTILSDSIGEAEPSTEIIMRYAQVRILNWVLGGED